MIVSKLMLTTLVVTLAMLSFSNGFSTLDLVVIVEASDSVFFGHWLLVQYFIKSLVTSLEEVGLCDIQVAVITYGKRPTLNWKFASKETSGVAAFSEAVDQLEQVLGKPTSFVPALNLASKVFGQSENRPNVPDVTLFITSSDVPSPGLKQAADRLKSLSTVFVVGISTNVNTKQLLLIATDEAKMLPMEDFYGVKNGIADLIENRDDCPNLLCQRNQLIETLTKDQLFYTLTSSNPETTVNVKKLTTISGIKMTKGEWLIAKGLRPFYMKFLCIGVQFVSELTVKGLPVDKTTGFKLKILVPSIKQDEWTYQCIKLKHSRRNKLLDKFEVRFTSTEEIFHLRTMFTQGCMPI